MSYLNKDVNSYTIPLDVASSSKSRPTPITSAQSYQ